jgi:hypothetical protein
LMQRCFVMCFVVIRVDGVGVHWPTFVHTHVLVAEILERCANGLVLDRTARIGETLSRSQDSIARTLRARQERAKEKALLGCAPCS